MATAATLIPTIDFSPFFREGDEDGKKMARDLISQACSNHGFFQAVNHGVPLPLMDRTMDLSRTFFSYPTPEKLKSKPGSGVLLPGGYSTQPEIPPHKNEYFTMYAPASSNNVFPSNPPHFKEVHEQIFMQCMKLANLVQDILNECLGLPPNFLKDYNSDRSSDFHRSLHYFPATGADESGKSNHEDGNFFTFVMQDDVGGLEVYDDGRWMPVPPAHGKLVVNVGDVLQVLSNNKFKSATHRVVRPVCRDRHSYAYFYNLNGDKRVEPLPHFTTAIGEAPKYKGFVYKDYARMRVLDRINPPSKPEDRIRISHYAI